ncbi:MAG: VWA domain-containing protein [Bacteroidetes bacterium]|nr:MAG: VWA domain-containing protein [Bacteroidota bacterium]
MKFSNPEFLWLFLAIPVMIFVYWYLRSKRPSYLNFSGFRMLQGYRPSLRQRLLHLPFVLRILAASALIVALARPQSSSSGQNITTQGIDIVMALDISASMLAEDLKPNRIEAAKKVAEQFIDSRPNDRIGLVVFSGESFTQCALTTDHAVIKNLFKGIQSGMLADGTAIGEGLATAVNRIRNSTAKSKVIILLTDGVNNIGAIAPLTAGEIARTFGIRVYTIGVGTKGLAPYPFKTPFGIQYQNMEVQIDEEVLQQIAQESGGKYFRATSTAKLKEIYDDIDKMEKTKISVTEYSHKSEEFYPLAFLAVILLGIEVLLRNTLLKTLP